MKAGGHVRSDNLRLLTTAVACSVAHDDAAFVMLQQDYIDKFLLHYTEKMSTCKTASDKAMLNVLQEMIHFAIKQVPIEVPSCKSLTYLETPEKHMEIAERFLNQDAGAMLTELAKRDTIRTAIKQFLHLKDRKGMYSAIESSKGEMVFSDFLDMFRNSCASNFQYMGTFLEYVMHCFTNFFYKSRKRDIWRTLSSVDFAKREVETNIVNPKVVRVLRDDDVQVHDLFVSIYLLNRTLYTHTGHQDENKGIKYCAFYLILQYLCQKQTTRINESLSSFKLALIDEQDRKEARNSLAENKGIAGKISNSWELVPTLFDKICKGEWDIRSISEMRDRLFALGKKDKDGKNCIWKDVTLGGETSRYFDMPDAGTVTNFINHEILVKGVFSIHNLMVALEERGMSLIDTYNIYPDMFKDELFHIHIDWLSGIKSAALQNKLREKAGNKQYTGGNHGELLVWSDAVDEHAGSAQNNRAHIRENRKSAQAYGLLSGGNSKHRSEFFTVYQQLRSIQGFLSAVPRSYDEYFSVISEDRMLKGGFAPKATLLPEYVVEGKYSSLYLNKFFAHNPDLAKYHLYGVAQGERSVYDMAWHIGTTMFTTLGIAQRYISDAGDPVQMMWTGLYIPMRDTFLLIPREEIKARFKTCDIFELQNLVATNMYNGQCNVLVQTMYDFLPGTVFSYYFKNKDKSSNEMDEALTHSMGFDRYLGIENFNSADICSRLERIPVYPKYKVSVAKFVEWTADLSKIQHSYIKLLQLMLTFALYTTRSDKMVVDGAQSHYGQALLNSLLKYEFTTPVLEWFFNELELSRASGTINELDFRWGQPQTGTIKFIPSDLSVLDIIYAKPGQRYSTDSFTGKLYKALRDWHTPAERFVQLYNYIAITIAYLRIIRDTFDLLFTMGNEKMAIFGCDINDRFKIKETLESIRSTAGSGGMLDICYAMLDTIPSETEMQFVADVRLAVWQEFSTITKALTDYLDGCVSDVVAVTHYDGVESKSVNVRREFKQFGSLFIRNGMYTDVVVDDLLSDLRMRLKSDDAGFFLSGNSYFKGRSGQSDYYVHCTGRMLEVRGDRIEPKSFDFNKELDRKLYEEIIRDGKRKIAW